MSNISSMQCEHGHGHGRGHDGSENRIPVWDTMPETTCPMVTELNALRRAEMFRGLGTGFASWMSKVRTREGFSIFPFAGSMHLTTWQTTTSPA